MELPLYLENILLFFALLAAALVGLYLLTLPFKWFARWLLNGVAGVIVLFLLHTFGPGFGLEVPLNAITLVVSVLLGLPGVALILLKILFL